ncbi:MAG: hypothetical protein RLZZ158_545 [Cyanobacteriota bacterium]|jgi:hypothetical protein
MVDRFFEGGLEERLEGWLGRGREFVDGVSGARPGSRRQGMAGPGAPGRRPLEAISRRGLRPSPQVADLGADDSWPEDDSFSLPRWQRTDSPNAAPAPAPEPELRRPEGASRPMPRSSRRRPG